MTIPLSFRRRGPAARLAVEQLEDRTVPSTFTVKNLHDAGPDSLRAAIIAANATPGADLIKFAGNLKGTITLASELSITEDLTLDGPGAGKITVSGGNATRVFRVDGFTTDVRIDDLKIANGRAESDPIPSPSGDVAIGGGILNVEGNLTLDRVVVANNQALGGVAPFASGGGVANVFGARLTVTHSTFRDNTVANGIALGGGAIYSDVGASADIRHSRFIDNRVIGDNTFGGAIESAASALAVSDCTFAGNLAQSGAGGGVAFGGAINVEPFGYFVGLPSSAAIDSSVFVGNRALGGPGGIGFGGAVGLFTSGTAATVSDCTFAGNLAQGGDGGPGGPGGQGNGGGLGVSYFFGDAPSVVTVSGSSFVGNRGRGGDGGTGAAGGISFGGAILNIGSTLAVDTSSFVGNEAHGGVGVGSATKAAGLGGAISSTTSDAPATTDVTDSVFVGNRAVGGDGVDGSPGHNGGGGGIFNFRGVLTVEGGLFLGNQAVGGVGGVGGGGFGGGVYNGVGGSALISDTRLIGNQALGGAGGTGGAGQGGGLHNAGTGTMAITDSDVLANRAAGGAGVVAGTGTGGGVYNAGLITIDGLSLIAGNTADEHDDLFGYP